MEAVTGNPQELDEIIDQYEAAQRRDGTADLARFLPEREHPLYLPALRELVRVDLEYSWQRGQPRALADYQRRFPELFEDPASLNEVAFEEYRLRRQAGEDPSPEEYKRRFNLSTQGWPRWGPTASVGDVSPARQPGDEQVQAAHAYQDFRLHYPALKGPDLDAWLTFFAGNRLYARLFSHLHAAEPATAAQLNRPTGLALDSGILYITDGGNHRVRKVVLSTGIITTVAGSGAGLPVPDGGPATSAKLSLPQGIAVGSGSLYIADTNNHKVRRVDLSTGIMTTLAGAGGPGAFGGDGGPATAARLFGPRGGRRFGRDVSQLWHRRSPESQACGAARRGRARRRARHRASRSRDARIGPDRCRGPAAQPRARRSYGARDWLRAARAT